MKLAEAIAAVQQPRNGLLHLLAGMGMIGLFLLSAVDASFIPLPLPGATDILLVVLAAKQHQWIWMTVVATAGSVLGGGITYQLGKVGGMHTLEKYTPKRYLKRITDWTKRHGFLAVALPAILPPPMPLIPFMIAAGVLKVPQKTFYTAFTISRAIRHGFAAWLGYHYGRSILALWSRYSAEWSTPLLIALWTIVIVASAYAIWRLIQRGRKEARGHLSPQNP